MSMSRQGGGYRSNPDPEPIITPTELDLTFLIQLQTYILLVQAPLVHVVVSGRDFRRSIDVMTTCSGS